MISNNMHLYTKNFDSAACHIDLAILSRKFKVIEHVHSGVAEYSNFFLQNSIQLCNICLFSRL